MQIYLMRHGTAVSKGTLIYPHDDRPLTSAGIREMTKASRGMVKLIPSLDAILSSPMKRSLKSAAIVAGAFGAVSLVKASASLLPGGDIRRVKEGLAASGADARVLLVGHEPDIALLASLLLGLRAPVLQFKKGALCRIDLEAPPARRAGKLIWHLTSKHMRLIADAS